MDGLEPFNSKLVTQTYIGYSEQNHRKNTIVCRAKIAAMNGEPRGWACLSTPPKGNKLSKKWVVVRQERGEKVGT